MRLAGILHPLAALLFVFLVASACGRSALPASGSGEDAQLHRLVAIFDYIGADYSGAVSNGRVIDTIEYQEQVAFAAKAREILAGLPDHPPELVQELADLEAACRSKAPATRVRELVRSARQRVVDAYGLVQSPATPPAYEKGARLFITHCPRCHGPDGVPPPEKVQELKPPPRVLSDRKVLGALSPYRVFNALTFGVEGTAMPSFDALPAADRWNLAFYVFTLRGDAKPDASLVPSLGRFPMAALATATDEELRQELARGVLDPPYVEQGLDALRMVAPYGEKAARAPVATARRLVEKALDLARAGRHGEAGARLLDAYFSGFEPAEGPLRVIDPSLVAAVESEFMLLRRALADRDPEKLSESTGRLQRLLGRAELLLAGEPRSPWFGVAAGALIVLREGAEAALLVLLLLASVVGAARRDAARFIHMGWVFALIAGGLTFAVARALTSRIAVHSEIVEAIASLLASAVLFYVSHWMVGQLQATRWMAFIKERVQAHLSQGRLLALSGLAFLAVYREAVETVLFFEGLLATGPELGHVIVGAVGGGTGLMVLVLALRHLGNRLPLRAFFAVSSVFMYALCVVFAGKGVHALIASGVVAPRPLPAPTIPPLGVYGDVATLSAQGLLLLAVGMSLHLHQRRPGAALSGPDALGP